jgi:hypothetical protein
MTWFRSLTSAFLQQLVVSLFEHDVTDESITGNSKAKDTRHDDEFQDTEHGFLQIRKWNREIALRY